MSQEKPRIAGRRSIKLELEPGKYAYCACGYSTSQPFCDGSHCTTSFGPIIFTITEAKRYSLCSCKRTATPPFCDHAHRELTREDFQHLEEEESP